MEINQSNVEKIKNFELEAIKMSQDLIRETKACMIKSLNSNMAYSQLLKMPLFVESFLTLPIPNIDHRANCTAVLIFNDKITNDKSTVVEQTTISNTNVINSVNNATENFVNNFEIKELNALTHKRLKKSKILETENNTKSIQKKIFNNVTTTTDNSFQTTTAKTNEKNDKICKNTTLNKFKWISIFPNNGKFIKLINF